MKRTFVVVFVIVVFVMFSMAGLNAQEEAEPADTGRPTGKSMDSAVEAEESVDAAKKVRHYLFLPFPSLFQFETVYGAEGLLTLHSLWSKIDSGIIPTSLPFLSENTFLGKTGNISYRFAKLFLLDYPINFVLPSLIHEFFGHGMRFYQAGYYVTELSVSLPPPFASQLPFIRAGNFSEVKSTEQQAMLYTLGGSEASSYTANLVRRNVLLSGYFDYRSSFLYLYVNNDLNGYSAFASGFGDIANYIADINGLYENSNKQLDDTKMMVYGLIGILGDPLNYYSFYNIFKEYLYDGNTDWRIPWITLSNKAQLRYLPRLGFGLTPYGVELFVSNYLKHKDTLYSLDVRFSDGTFEPSWRVETKIWNIPVTRNIAFDVEAQIWNQPKIKYYLSNELKESEGLGGQLFFTYNHDNIVKDFAGFMLQFGYKSAGYAEGELLRSGFIARSAITLSF